MSDLVLAGAGVALLSLVWSEFPFIQLVYFMAITSVVDWTQWATVTGFMFLATFGASLYKRLRS